MGDETRQLIEEAEELAGKSSSRKAPKTKQLVSESERLIGRETSGGGSKWIMIVMALVVGAVGAAVFMLQK